MKLNHWLKVLLGASLLLGFAGCQTQTAQPDTTEPAATTGPQTRLITEATTGAARGRNYTWKAFPTNAIQPTDALVLVEKEVPKEVKPNETFTYEIVVSNRSSFRADEVVLTETLPANFELTEVSPQPERRQDMLQWNFGSMSPGQREIINVSGYATRSGTLRLVGSTDIYFSLGRIDSVVAVVEPLFEFVVDNQATAVINELIPTSMSFRNTGSAPVRNAKLLHTLPEGLVTETGTSSIELDIGNLQPGERKSYDMNLKGIAVGPYETTMVATANDGLSASAVLSVNVQRPILEIDARAPDIRFVGNVLPYDIVVRNVGNAVARNTVITQELSDGTTLASANEGGEARGRIVVWEAGTLQPGEAKRVNSRVVAEEIMTARSVMTAEADAADEVQAVAVTDIQGIPAILIEMGDINDPVPVGEVETYTITASNTGSLAATNVVLKCILEDSMEFVKSSGASKSSLEGNVLTFEALPALAPANEATWRVEVRAVRPGDVRFTVTIESNELSRPVTENEATNFYD